MFRVSVSLVALSAAAATPVSPWPPSARVRAAALVAEMTLPEKLSQLQGSGEGGYAGTLPAIPRLGIPEMTLEDSPQGVGDGLQHVTAFPCALVAASSWDTDLMQEWGVAMGLEQFMKGTTIMLGPGTNLARVPLNGRLYEYYSEEPTLSAALVAAVVRGVQANNVSSCVKHFLGNSQEWERGAEDAEIPERALHEMYTHAFQAAAAAGAGSFMLGVNKVRGLENSANAETMDLLFADAAFEGFFVTDWAGIVIPNASAAAIAGTSVEMPRGFQYQFLPQFLANGSLAMSVIDGLVTRVLTTEAALGLLDTLPQPERNPGAVVTSAAHVALARTLAARGSVLLKNAPAAGDAAPVLPLDPARLPRGILVLGDTDTVTGCGSGEVRVTDAVTPYAGLYSALNPGAVRPVNCTFLPGVDFFQDGATCATVTGTALEDACCALCTATSTCNAWTLVPGVACPAEPASQPAGQCFLKPDTAGQRPHGGITSGTCAPLPPSNPPLLTYAGTDPAAAAALAATVDAVIVVAATPAHEPQPGCEGVDRLTLALPPATDALIAAVATANPRTVVVTRTGGAALMPWLAAVPAVLHMGLSGQEAGNALADLVLLGGVNPGGKLTITFPASDAGTWLTTPEQYPGVLNTSNGFWETNYTEGLLVGYRYFDATPTAPAPLFFFGHGLSYSTFSYDALSVTGSVSPSSSATATLRVTNTAGPAGHDVVQLYVAGALPGDPVRTLRAFASTGALAPGAATTVALTLTAADLRLWDTNAGAWAPYPPGVFALWVGASSADLRLSGNVTVGV